MFQSIWFNDKGERRTVSHDPAGLNAGVIRRVVELLVQQEAVNILPPGGRWQSNDVDDVVDRIWRTKQLEGVQRAQRQREKTARLKAKRAGHDRAR